MYLTKRDKDILRWVDKWGSITINQCSKIFYTNNKEAYQQSRKRLKKLSDNKFLRRYRKDMQSESIYYLDKKLSLHDLKVFDVYGELIEVGATIKNFIPRYKINTPEGHKQYRELDALVEFTYNNYFCPVILEIDYTHFTTHQKIQDIYESEHFQDRYLKITGEEDIFPQILIARPFIFSDKINDKVFNIYYTDFDNISIQDIL